MSFRFTDKKRFFTGTLFLTAVVFLLILNANAQCPGGKPPNPDGSCGNPPPKRTPPLRKPVKAPVAKKRPTTSTNTRNRPTGGATSRRNAAARRRPGSIDGTATCTINVRVTGKNGEPLASVNLVLNDPSLS